MITPSYAERSVGRLPVEPLGDTAPMLPISLARRRPWRRPASAGRTSTCSASMPTGPIPGSDGLGLLPLLNSGKIVALDAEGAVLETPGGTRQSYRRKPDQPGRVLIPPAGIGPSRCRSARSRTSGTLILSMTVSGRPAHRGLTAIGDRRRQSQSEPARLSHQTTATMAAVTTNPISVPNAMNCTA